MLAPALLLPLGLILLRTPVLPWPFAPAAVILGVTGPVLGLAGLFTVTANKWSGRRGDQRARRRAGTVGHRRRGDPSPTPT